MFLNRKCNVFNFQILPRNSHFHANILLFNQNHKFITRIARFIIVQPYLSTQIQKQNSIATRTTTSNQKYKTLCALHRLHIYKQYLHTHLYKYIYILVSIVAINNKICIS